MIRQGNKNRMKPRIGQSEDIGKAVFGTAARRPDDMTSKRFSPDQWIWLEAGAPNDDISGDAGAAAIMPAGQRAMCGASAKTGE
jgi:hypothetical protein